MFFSKSRNTVLKSKITKILKKILKIQDKRSVNLDSVYAFRFAAIEQIQSLAVNNNELKKIDGLTINLWVKLRKELKGNLFGEELYSMWGYERFFKALRQWEYSDVRLIRELYSMYLLPYFDYEKSRREREITVKNTQKYLGWDDVRFFRAIMDNEIIKDFKISGSNKEFYQLYGYNEYEVLANFGWSNERTTNASNMILKENVKEAHSLF